MYLESEELNMEKIPEWIYAPTNFSTELEKTFEAVEKALGFKLFIWQKTFIANTTYRRSGRTTAEMTLGSLFDGIAGFPLAARRQGIKTVWVSEIEPDCIDIAKRHFPEALQLGDITQIDGAKIPVVDIISFGSPCQDLSVAGKQTGLDGSRSGLFMEAVRITREMREKTNGQYPKYIIWENVAGAFSSNKGEDFRRVLEEITQSNISMPKSGKWATAGMVGNEGPGGGRSVYRMAIT